MVLTPLKPPSLSTLRTPSLMAADLAATRPPPAAASEDLDSPISFNSASPPGPRVCVIGAGVAGLRAAEVLMKGGARVTVLEGRDRVGGRLAQATLDGHVVDLGPNWIHGTQDNPIHDLVRSTKTPTHTWGSRQLSFTPSGAPLPKETTTQVTEAMWSLVDTAFAHSNANWANIPSDMSLLDFIHTNIQNLPPFAPTPDGRSDAEKRLLVGRMAQLWGGYIGGTTAGQSLRFLWLEECLDGENLFCAGTYRKVLDVLTQPVLEGVEEVRFGAVVERVVTRPEGGVGVVTRGGREEVFDHVVVTAPLGWLKRHSDAFDPPLPQRVQLAIEALGYGNLEKIYVSFPRAFWDSPPSPTTDSSTIPAPVPPPSIATGFPPADIPTTDIPPADKPPTDDLPPHIQGFTTWLQPAYATATNPSSHAVEAFNLAALPEGTSHPTLLFYISGPLSSAWTTLATQTPTPPTTSSPILHLPAASHPLLPCLQPYLTRLPHYDATNPDHQPRSILSTHWAKDELAGEGSYTNFPVGVKDADGDIRALREGCPERGVWFAGEHTAPFVAVGTVTGAWWAGGGVGTRLLEMWEKEGGARKERE
ncbi:FAD/NAD(P)-binding domain-containing protein [Trichodelitschia bisporula]|uniref:FAD/NAD(P)-binding domain-containing protein n=1 Tax=Trichodelitschia bisporula TaxID=703511 RepID=A0A6G1HPC8_9PEZI|nr:FAD/NAD(P)-binding domain-containing protein [Trichodelitschia bisporula]